MSVGLILSACATAPSKGLKSVADSAGVDRALGEWVAKILVEDKIHDQNHSLRAECIAREPDQLRMDVTSSMGIYVASLTLNKNQMQSLLPRQHKFLEGPARSAAIESLIHLPLDPRWLIALLFDHDLPAVDWTCQKDAHDFKQHCQLKRSDVAITWQERSDIRRVLLLESPRAKVHLSIEPVSTKAQVSTGTFHLDVPEGYQSTPL
jgi:hypothetical protein